MRRHLLVMVIAGMAATSACGGPTATPVGEAARAQDGGFRQGADGTRDDLALCADVIAWSSRVADSANAFLAGGSRDVQFAIVARASDDAAMYAERASDPTLKEALTAGASGLRTVSQSAGVSVAGATLAGDVLEAGRPPLERCTILSAGG